MVPVFVAAAAGERLCVRRRRWVDSDSLKREKESCYKNSHCLFKQKAWLLSVGWKFFFAIKEASQFCLTFNLELSFKKVCTC